MEGYYGGYNNNFFHPQPMNSQSFHGYGNMSYGPMNSQPFFGYGPMNSQPYYGYGNMPYGPMVGSGGQMVGIRIDGLKWKADGQK